MSQINLILRRGAALVPGACEEMHPLPDSWTFNGDVDKPTFSPSFKQTFVHRTGGEDERGLGLGLGEKQHRTATTSSPRGRFRSVRIVGTAGLTSWRCRRSPNISATSSLPMIVPHHLSLWEAASSERSQAFLLVGTLDVHVGVTFP
jgi:hypothetical protein